MTYARPIYGLKVLFLGATLSMLLLLSWNTYAHSYNHIVSAVAKVLSLSKETKAGDLKIAFVYSSDHEFQHHVDHLNDLLKDGYVTPKHIIYSELLSEGDVDEAHLKKYNALFIEKAVSENSLAKIKEWASSHQILTVTNHIPFVENGFVMIGVEKKEKINVVMNKEAVANAGLTFDPSIHFIAHEI